MNELINELVKIASAEVGTKEEGGNNLGKKIRQYQTATWLTPGAWPWCAAFVCWCLLQWLKLDAVRKYFNLEEDETISWRCRDASAFGFIKWADRQKLTIYREDKDTSAPPALAKAGDIAVFDFSHIGIVVEDQLKVGDRIKLVEGNTNGKGDRDSVYGDGVWNKSRRATDILCLIRLIPDENGNKNSADT